MSVIKSNLCLRELLWWFCSVLFWEKWKDMRTKWDFLLISTTAGAESFPWFLQAQLPVLRCWSTGKCSFTKLGPFPHGHSCPATSAIPQGQSCHHKFWHGWGWIHSLTDLKTEAKAPSWMLARTGARLGSSPRRVASQAPAWGSLWAALASGITLCQHGVDKCHGRMLAKTTRRLKKALYFKIAQPHHSFTVQKQTGTHGIAPVVQMRAWIPWQNLGKDLGCTKTPLSDQRHLKLVWAQLQSQVLFFFIFTDLVTLDDPSTSPYFYTYISMPLSLYIYIITRLSKTIHMHTHTHLYHPHHL